MAVPGRPHASAPAGLAETELFSVDAYVRDFETTVQRADRDEGRVALRRTAFYPGAAVSRTTWERCAGPAGAQR